MCVLVSPVLHRFLRDDHRIECGPPQQLVARQEELNALVTEDDGLTDAAHLHIVVSSGIPGL